MEYNIAYNDLVKSIKHWNEYRVPILRICQPDKALNFQGAMRFYFQDSGQKVATKCVNVTSNDTTKDVINVLIEKFRPDMRMLSVPEYGLYEIHENGDERKLMPDERPLFVQLEWNNDDREGRFLLRKMDEKTRNLAAQNEEPSLKRKLSKKEKKKQEKLKKQQQKVQEKAEAAASKLAAKGKNGIAERLYNELPETSFTRSISNPEAVMKRRRAQKLEKRLQEFSIEGGQEAGGTLRIFGESINKDVSYKTLLLSTKDTATFVVKQILEKYGKENEDSSNYCLVKLIVPSSATLSGGDNNSVHDLNTSTGLRESILEDNDCPLLINQTHDKSRGILTFHIRPKPSDYHKRRKKKPSRVQAQQNPLHPLVVQQLNQRLLLNNTNNNSDQFRDQNSPQNSSQTSGSITHDSSNPPPPPFETVHSMPSMYPPRANGNGVMYYQQQQPHSMSTLPPRINSHQVPNSMHTMNATLQRPSYNQPPVLTNQTRPLAQIHPQSNLIRTHSMPSQPQIHQPYIPPQPTSTNDQILPALIQVKEDVEDLFLSTVITNIIPTKLTFRLAPTYVLYMVSRYRASTLFHPELQAPDRAELFMPFTRKIAFMIRNTIEAHAREPMFLAFWLANSSDLNNFYNQDKHLSHFTADAQAILYDSMKSSFNYLLSCRQLELDRVLHAFFDERDDSLIDSTDSNQTAVQQILNVLNETMSTMRKNRVNAILTIQLFTELFHHINKWLFDRLIGVYDNQPGILGNQANFEIYCNRAWGEKFNRRLIAICRWAQEQGLEQAAEFNLRRVIQLTFFLKRIHSPEVTPHDLIKVCDELNNFLNIIQLRALLERYRPDLPKVGEIIKSLLYQYYTYKAGDHLLEAPKLDNEFIMPDEGYSSEIIRYIPSGLLDYVKYLSKIHVGQQELCIFTVQPTSSGYWTVYFKSKQQNAPEVIDFIQLRKKNNSMGLSIIAAKGVGQDQLGIYIKNVVKDGAAAQDGRLQAGDQLLEVDGHSLLNITQEQAADLMLRTGSVVILKIAKGAAHYHHVSDIIGCVSSQATINHQQQQQQQQLNPPPVLPPPQVFAPAAVPPPPAPFEPAQPSNHMQSPMKSPKKVSWVDTQPHQSLHTLIPLPQDPEPSEITHGDTNGRDQIHVYPDDNFNYRHQNLGHTMVGRHLETADEEGEDEDEDEDEDDDSMSEQETENLPSNGQNHVTSNGQEDAVTNGLADTTAESLTLEDIDEVLSSKQTNNWLEDSAGVIGTQEVYNDPRQRIVSQRERATEADINIEKLSFQEKLKMFNLSAKK